jgi:hypothetical protein
MFFSYFLSPNLDFFQSDSVLLPYNLELFSAKIMEALELFRCLCFKPVFALNSATELASFLLFKYLQLCRLLLVFHSGRCCNCKSEIWREASCKSQKNLLKHFYLNVKFSIADLDLQFKKKKKKKKN